MRCFKRYGWVFLKGLLIGAADLMPGISGGTVALITGVYEELLDALQAWNGTALGLLRHGEVQTFWQHIRGGFLLPLALGIGLSLLTTVQLVSYLLAHHPIQSWAFFLGLLFISTLMVYQKILHWRWHTVVISVLGIFLSYGITSITPLNTPNTSFFLLLSGILCICAMLLPGISGSFVLVLLGKYGFMLHALKTLNLPALLPFAAGGVVGIFAFSRMLAGLLRWYHDPTLSLLAGFMLGALHKVWPWQHAWGGANNINLWPQQFQEVCQKDPLLAQALFWWSVGILVVLALERQAQMRR